MTVSPKQAPNHKVTDQGANNQVLIGQTADWLMDEALHPDRNPDPVQDLADLFNGCCHRLAAAGVPLWRAHITFRILHPLYGGMGLTWRRGTGTEVFKYPHHDRDTPSQEFRTSPFYHMISTEVPYLRRRLIGSDAVFDFTVLEDLRDQGATDYLGFLLYFGEEQIEGLVGSWTTDRPSGFSDQDFEALVRVQKRLGVAFKMRLVQQIAQNVVSTYLGENAGLRVLHGQIRRGDGERIRAVIWYADLRGSSALAAAMPPDDYIACLNAYFEAVGSPVIDAGGEILGFIGDAILAIFPTKGSKKSACAVCQRALKAGFAAEKRLSALNDQRASNGDAPLAFGLALHFGHVVFGNIGLPQRLAFSVIGPTVNEVARLEALSKKLDQAIVASESFAQHTTAHWERLGRYELRGIGTPIEVMAPSR